MSDIAERLLKAIGEKEVMALAPSSLKWKTHDTHVDSGGHCAVVMNEAGDDQRPLVAWLPTFKHPGWDVPAPWANAAFIADNDPASILRRCAADREIVEACSAVLANNGDSGVWNGPELARFTLSRLARGYGLEETR